MKKEYVGWLPQDLEVYDALYWLGCYLPDLKHEGESLRLGIDVLYKRRGTKEVMGEDWPLRKVKITIEDI